MPFLPATGIKLGNNTEFGRAFAKINVGNMQNVKSLDGAVNSGFATPGYLHISTSICTGGHGDYSYMSKYTEIVNNTAEKIKNIHSIKTGKLSVSEHGYVILEIVSPEVTKIVKNMEDELTAAGIRHARKSNPVHITLRKGMFGAGIQSDARAEIDAILGCQDVQALQDRSFSLEAALFGAINYGGKKATVTDEVPSKTLTGSRW